MQLSWYYSLIDIYILLNAFSTHLNCLYALLSFSPLLVGTGSQYIKQLLLVCVNSLLGVCTAACCLSLPVLPNVAAHFPSPQPPSAPLKVLMRNRRRVMSRSSLVVFWVPLG
jgi:hypothetical protein